ncbi:MAG: HlyD family type I secretion periplasmic adaptor subunit [Spirulinaceae cyanobacterium]
MTPQPNFDRQIMLRQSPGWSRAIVWTIMSVTTVFVAWAYFAQIDQAIPAQGKLEPKGAVKAVQAPVGGVVEKIHVTEGERVNANEVLITFDKTAAQAQLQSLQKIRSQLLQENLFYRSQMRADLENQNTELNQQPEYFSLTENRAALVAESRYYNALLNNQLQPTQLNSAQQARFRASQTELASRVAAAQLDIEQLNRQLAQVQIQQENARSILAVNQQILDDITPLVAEGGIPRIQYLRQEQEVKNSEAETIRLDQEEKRLELAIKRSEERLKNTIAVTQDQIFNRIAENEKRIAEIDSQLSKAIVENEKQIAEIDSQIQQNQLTLTYQDVRSPVDGMVFDLQPQSKGFVAQSSEPILKIVPQNTLVANVFVTNRDIGFVEVGMPVDVRIDSFPFSEFGDIQGEITHIASDVLPPNDVYPFYRFPVEITLENQEIIINNYPIGLQSGMSVNANIKLRKQRVISIITDIFIRKLDNFN